MIRFLFRALAVWRMTELVVEDEVSRPVREWVARRWPGSKVAYLTSCKSCVSVWAALVVLVVPEWLTTVLALSGATITANELRDHVAERAFQRRMAASGVRKSESSEV